jgi:multiple sugar transport system ATP-binding protein
MNGRVVTRLSPKDRDVAFIFQHSALYPHLTVYRNLAMGLAFRWGGGWLSRIWRQWSRPAQAAAMAAQRRGIRQRVWETAEILGIEQLLDRMPRQLSGGERQRVALGRALVRQPAVFLLDEPLANLDANLRFALRQELRLLQRKLAATMVYVTHDQQEAMALGDRIAVIERGSIHQVGTPQAVYREPQDRFVASCVGQLPMNLLAGRLQVAQHQWEFRGAGLQLLLPAGPQRFRWAEDVELGVRPEHVRLIPAEQGERDAAARPFVCGRGVVAHVEMLGDQDLVHVALAGEREVDAGQRLVGQERPGRAPRVGGAVDVLIEPEQIHLFEGSSGASLRHTAAGARRVSQED